MKSSSIYNVYTFTGLLRNRIIIREKSQAKWRKRKSGKVKSDKFENEQYEEDIFYPDLLGSEVNKSETVKLIYFTI